MLDWTHWHNEPHLIGGLILLGWLYALATGPFHARLAPPETQVCRWRSLCFYLSLVVFYLAVGSPLDQAGERFLLSAHMVQHLLIIHPAAILFLIGLPPWLASRLFGRPFFRPLGRLIFHPAGCALIYTLLLSLWHLPAAYDLALRERLVHIAEHICFFIGGLFLWWPVCSPAPQFPPARYPVQMIYWVGVTILMTPLFAYLAFYPEVLYPTYEYAPRLFAGFSPAQDQLLGAAIMKLGGMFISFLAFIWAFYRWYQATERRNGSPDVPVC